MPNLTDTVSHSYHLIQSNIECLSQGLSLLGSLSDVEYTQLIQPAFPNGIGAHIRHIVDHYTCFLDGLDRGRIDYEARRRDTLVANNRIAASEAMNGLIERLRLICEERHEQSIEVFLEHCVVEGHLRQCAQSSVERELQFLVSHTVHHYALIAVNLCLIGRKPAKGFGVSPSTSRYRSALRSRPVKVYSGGIIN